MSKTLKISRPAMQLIDPVVDEVVADVSETVEIVEEAVVASEETAPVSSEEYGKGGIFRSVGGGRRVRK